MGATVVAVSVRPDHFVSKENADSIRLLEGLGVEGDAHCGPKARHLSRVRRNPDEDNRRQVHLIQSELHDELRERGFELAPGQMGENVTTRGVDLLGLPAGARLRLGGDAVVEVTGLRTPCVQLDGIQPGLMKAVLAKRPDGEVRSRTGVMGIVVAGGEVRPDDPIAVEMPEPPHTPLEPV
jgi:MOSC domain-containing protein YiiM